MHLPLPSGLVRAAGQEPELQRWVHGLPALVDELTGRWDLALDLPFQPGGTCSWVAPAVRGTGEHVVLKLGWRHEEARDEVAGLRHWDGAGTVRLLADADVGASTTAALLERCRPGTASSAVLGEPEQDEVLAGLLRRTWVGPADGHPFRPISALCATWARGVEARRAERRPDHLDEALVDDGLATWLGLSHGGDEVLLCTDLHAGNVLAAEREPWLVVDPKPYAGDRAFDVLQHALNCPQRLQTDPLGLVDRLAGLLELDRGRLRSWLFARCVVGSLDAPYLQEVARRLAP